MRHRVAVFAAATAAGVVATFLVAPSTATAHGVAIIPGSRTYLCFVDGLRSTGEIIAFNPACADAIAQGGTQPLYDWFGVLRSDANGRTVGFIPDGEICGGGTTKYAAYNMARTDWPLTHLSSGSTIQFRYSNWAAHPGTFRVSITRDGWTPNTPLAWGDLVSFWSSTDPPQSGGPGAFNYYFFDVTLPVKTGRHMIFIQWVRSDSQENFFSCSDVVFDGGHGEVTGVGPNGSQPPTSQPPTSQPPTSQPPTSQPPTSQPPTTSPPPTGNGACAATWATTATNWPGHFQANVTVRNTGTAALNGWTVRWTYTGGQGFEGPPWNGVVTGQPPNVAIRNADWNRTLAGGATTSFGFNATGTAPSPAPTLTCSSP
jgi:chitin-binding protein